MTDRQQEIINTSMELIAEGGIQALTIKNLAKKIGFAESAIYRHYENKIQILLAILDYFKTGNELLYKDILNESGSSLQLIKKIFALHLQKFYESPSLVPVIFSEEIFRNEEELSKKVSEIMKNSSEKIRLLLVRGQQEGEVRDDIDVSHLALMTMGSLRMFVKMWDMSGNKFDLVKEGGKFTESIVKVISKAG